MQPAALETRSAPGARWSHYEQYAAELRDECAPAGALQETAFQQFARAAWNLLRLRAWESQILDAENAFTDPEAIRTLDLLSRQAARLERSMRDARAHLLELQALSAEAAETEFAEQGTDQLDSLDELDEPVPARAVAAAAPVAYPLRL
jgi:hypothetical protein